MSLAPDTTFVPASDITYVSFRQHRDHQYMSARKSILKTPGTAKGKPKCVIFNEKLHIKKFNFILDSDDENNPKQQHSAEESSMETYEKESQLRKQQTKIGKKFSYKNIIKIN